MNHVLDLFRENINLMVISLLSGKSTETLNNRMALIMKKWCEFKQIPMAPFEHIASLFLYFFHL